MGNTIKIKHSDTASAAPASLSAGELAINRRDKKLYYTDHNNVVQSKSLEAEGGGGGGMTWNEVTGTTQSAANDNGYITNNASLVVVTIPTTAAFGKVIRIGGKGAGGWKVAQNASQNIRFGNQVSTTGTGGYLASSNQYDCIELLCIVADTTWLVISSIGNITIV